MLDWMFICLKYIAYVIKKEPISEKDKVSITKLFMKENNGTSLKWILKKEKIAKNIVTKSTKNKTFISLGFNFIFCLTNVGPIEELKIVAGNDPNEKHAKKTAAISFG